MKLSIPVLRREIYKTSGNSLKLLVLDCNTLWEQMITMKPGGFFL